MALCTILPIQIKPILSPYPAKSPLSRLTIVRFNMNDKHSSSFAKQTKPVLQEAVSNEAVSGLVAGVSHEINTPLGVNIGNCTLLIELLDEISKKYNSGALDAEFFCEFLDTARDLSASMLKNMRKASKLLSTFKQVAVKNTDEANMLEQVDIAECANEFVAAHAMHNKSSQITFAVKIPPGAVVSTYPAVITQILTALTSNTFIHGLGVGISEELLPKVFDPFFTTRRGAGNAGLGLSIVHNLVREVLKSEVYY
ncbi:MAG: HAMP domain-containing histidine kinase [Gammaproteobacteria bacterium]|nr:HAMP domain-containing histidine kinase [Gammaproteobacteria bacterium]